MSEQLNILEEIKKRNAYKNSMGQLLPWEECPQCEREIIPGHACEYCGYATVTDK